MKLFLPILLLVFANSGNAEFCGCGDSCRDVWDSVATASDGSYTCGARINWLQSAQGFSESDACANVSSEFSDGPCGPVCDPTKCNPPKTTYCGCDSCDQDVWDTVATASDGSYSCGARINWMQTVMGFDEEGACTKVSSEFIDGPCGPVCDPTKCNAPSMCGCTSCTKDVLDSIAGGFSCENRINWVIENKGFSEADACKLVGDEYPSICGMCHADHCGPLPPTPPPTPPAHCHDPCIAVDTSVSFQNFYGVGASMTGSSAFNLENVVSKALKSSMLQALFDPITGIGLNLLRQPMGASDFSSEYYTYEDVQGVFDISKDAAYIIPAIQSALAVNPDIKIMGLPWSYPVRHDEALPIRVYFKLFDNVFSNPVYLLTKNLLFFCLYFHNVISRLG